MADFTDEKQAWLRLGCLGPSLGSVADFDHNPICFSLSASLFVCETEHRARVGVLGKHFRRLNAVGQMAAKKS